MTGGEWDIGRVGNRAGTGRWDEVVTGRGLT